MKILVTGGFGFIGSNLVENLLLNGHSIKIIDNLQHDQIPEKFSFFDKIEFFKKDISKLDEIEDCFKEVDIVFHLAALANVRRGLDDPKSCFDSNISGTFNVLMASIKNNVKKIIFSSSREVYGNCLNLPVNEEEKRLPINFYGLSKKISEDLLNILKNDHLKISIFRLSNVYGKNDNVPGRVIPSFINKAKKGELLEIYGGDQILDFVWIKDVIKCFLEELDTNSSRLKNICSGKGITIKELANKIIFLTKSNSEIKLLKKLNSEVDKYIGDSSKLGFTPTPLEEGLKYLILGF